MITVFTKLSPKLLHHAGDHVVYGHSEPKINDADPFSPEADSNLVWCNNSDISKEELALLPCDCVHRVTPLHLAANPTQCLMRHVLSSEIVSLSPSPDAPVSHVIVNHNGTVFLHCIAKVSRFQPALSTQRYNSTNASYRTNVSIFILVLITLMRDNRIIRISSS